MSIVSLNGTPTTTGEESGPREDYIQNGSGVGRAGCCSDFGRSDRLAAFPEENPNPVLEVDGQGTVVYANPASRSLLTNLEAGDVLGMLPVNHTALVRGCLKTGISVREAEAAVSDRVFSWSYHPVPAGRVVHLYGFDVTDRKRAEEATLESETRLKAVMDRLPEGVCLLDGDKRLVSANPAAREMLDVLTDGPADGVLSQLGPHPTDRLLEPRPDGLAHEVVLETRPSRSFTVEARPMSIETDGEGWVIVIDEVTHEREAQDRIHRQERLAAVGQLAAGIAHDFNNHLTGVVGFSQLLELREDVPDSAKESLRSISTQGQRAAQLVRQILDFSRQTVAERQPLDLVPILKENLKLLDRTLPESIEVRSDFGREDSVVQANPAQIQQVLTNLAVNARDAMPDGGQLDLKLSLLEVSPGDPPPLPGMAAGRYVMWTVSDTGSGIPPDVLEHVFEPFYTTKGPGEGTGLGLAQVYGIVQQHGGEIDVESKVGEGTRFRIYLPAAAVSGQAETPDPADLPRGRGETILLVEDQPEVLEVTRSMLQSLNYRVLTAVNGKEGVDVYRSNREAISLVLTDMVMPELNGLEMLEVLKKVDPEMRTVMMSGYPMDEGEGKVVVGGQIEKPLSVETLARTVREVLDNEGSATGGVADL